MPILLRNPESDLKNGVSYKKQRVLKKPSYADLAKNLFGLSAARSLYIGYLYGSQPKKCQNDVFLENRVPIDRFL